MTEILYHSPEPGRQNDSNVKSFGDELILFSHNTLMFVILSTIPPLTKNGKPDTIRNCSEPA